MDSYAAYERKKAKLLKEYAALRKERGEVRLGKSTSNLFRSREGAKKKLNVRAFTDVVEVDAQHKRAVVEGMCTFDAFTKATLKHGMLPAIVPQLKTITVGGGVSGGAIESSSFKYGLVHEIVDEMEILLGDGRVVTATRTNEHKDLFYGMANSYGTLGYILRLTVRLIPAKKYVRVVHTRFTDVKKYFVAVGKACNDAENDYVDGTVFSREEMYLTIGRFVATAPHHSNYKYHKMYFRSIQKRSEDYLTAYDYVWRWDKDWFWCSKNFGMHNTAVRLTAGIFLRGSKQYWKIMQWNGRFRVTERLGKIMHSPTKESVIQDVQIPLAKCPQFLDFFLKDIPLTPVWICPTRPQRTPRYPLYDMDPSKLYVNFGFWDVVTLPSGEKDGFYNRQVEAAVDRLDGQKSLYSTAYYDKKAFDKRYNGKTYAALKKKYDAGNAFLSLYEKTVKRK